MNKDPCHHNNCQDVRDLENPLRRKLTEFTKPKTVCSLLPVADSLTKWFVTERVVSMHYTVNALKLHESQTFVTEGFASWHKDSLVQVENSIFKWLGTKWRNQGNILRDSIINFLWDPVRETDKKGRNKEDKKEERKRSVREKMKERKGEDMWDII